MTGEQINLLAEYKDWYSSYDEDDCRDFEERFIKAFGDVNVNLVVTYNITAKDIFVNGFLPDVVELIDDKGFSPKTAYRNQVMMRPHVFIKNVIPREIRLCDGK
jgi:hypothetical protein